MRGDQFFSISQMLMRAVTCGPPGRMSLEEMPLPVPQGAEIRVRVQATAVNRADLLQRKGRHPPPPGASLILGLEMAGVVESVGPSCTRWKVGDAVMGLLPGGGYAEFAVLHEEMAMALPQNLTFTECAAIPEVFLTAYQVLFLHGGLQPGHTVLFHAGASGVGTAAIQLATNTGAAMYVTASPAKHETCLELGATMAVDYSRFDFADRVLQATGGRGVDLIVDCVGAPYFEQNLRSLAVDGCFVLLSTLGGADVKGLNLRALFRKRARLVATTLRNRSLSYKVALTKRFAEGHLSQFVDRRLRPVIDSVYALVDVEAAHEHMRANRNVGKIVLTVCT